MNHTEKIVLCLLAALVWSPAFSADYATNASLPVITVNGVMAMSGTRQVIFKAAGVNNNETTGFVLGEGESQNKIKVVVIDEKSGVVTFDNHGTIQKILIEKASPLNAYVPPPPAPVSAAVPPASIPVTSEWKTPEPSGGTSVFVMGSQRNKRPTESGHINGVKPQSSDNGTNYFVPGSPQIPKNISSANQPVQSASAPPPVTFISAMPAAPTPMPWTPPQPNGPQEISSGADTERVVPQPALVSTPAPNGSSK